jgi:RHS repeat-associated protein
LQETYSYNKRLDLSTAKLASSVLTGMQHSYGFADASGHNNGDVLSITDNLASAHTQTFTYDQLNRISSAVETSWGLGYVYDVYGNLLQQNVTLGSAPRLNVTVNGNNQMVGFTYDAAGNLTGDGSHTYQFDPENRLKTLDSGSGGTYGYDVNNIRITKTVGTDTAEYIMFGGYSISQHHSTNWNDWSDLVYLNGKLLAKADTYEDRIKINGTVSGSQYSQFTFANAAGYSGYVIRSGDTLFLRQWQSTGSHGGMQITFTDGTNTNWNVKDQDGQTINNDGTQQSWHYRRIDLSSFAGKTVSNIRLTQENTTTASPYTIYFTDIAIFSTDGTVRPIYNRQASISLAHSGTSTGTATVDHQSNESQIPDVTTTFYHSDHLGSSRLMSSANGYPVWQATYLPFGYEYNPQISVNNYKYTGYEHDSESGLEYANQRHFSSQYTRFMSPDPVTGDAANPQTWDRYSYVANNPLSKTDPQGLFIIDCSWGCGGFVGGFIGDGSYGGSDTGFNQGVSIVAPTQHCRTK